MSKCKQVMLAEGATYVPRSCPVHGLQRCPGIPQKPTTRQDGVVAWYNPSNTDPRQSVTFKREDHDRWPNIYPVALVPQSDTQQLPLSAPVVLELPDGDKRKVSVVWSEVRDGKLHLCIEVDEEPQKPVEPKKIVGILDVRDNGRWAGWFGIPDGVYDVIERQV